MKNPKEALGDKFGIPKDIALDLPHITMSGNREMYIENYKALMQYTADKIIIGNKKLSMTINGENMIIKAIEEDKLLILGNFVQIDFKM